VRHPRDHRQRHRQRRIGSVRKKLSAGVLSLDDVREGPGASLFVSGLASNIFNPGAASLEVNLARARLDHAAQQMDLLKSRIDYLERRAASSIGATERELEDLIWARDELAMRGAAVAHLSSQLEWSRDEESEACLDVDGWDEY
jgi:hypothetical protein